MSVNLRLLAACAVTGALAALVAVWSGAGGRPTAVVPACLAVGAVCAAVVAHLLRASARATNDPRLGWMSAGVTVAFAGMLASLAGQPTIFPDGGPVTQDADAQVARYLIWHAGLLGAAVLAVAKTPARRDVVVPFTAAGLALLAFASVADAPFGDLAGPFGAYDPGLRIAAAVLALGLLGAAAAWWRAANRAPSWGEMCVIAALGLSGADAAAYLFAAEAYEGAWWASLTLRAGQFAIPAVGLLLGFIAFADRLKDLQDELAANLDLERERARRVQTAGERSRRRIARLIEGEGLDIALQPIVDLVSREVVGAEALARFTDENGNPIPTEECFLDAHALGVGVDLELAVIDHAMRGEARLPEGLYLALNVSPTLLAGPHLDSAVERSDRPLVVELTEHQPVEDYGALTEALDRLRANGVRVAVDDVGSGFASFRHVTRVNPEILKLDRTLVCGIDEDPVRQSLAAAIVSFAADVGAIVVSEGIESEDELDCLLDLAVGCGQGYYLARPELGPVEAIAGGHRALAPPGA